MRTGVEVDWMTLSAAKLDLDVLGGGLPHLDHCRPAPRRYSNPGSSTDLAVNKIIPSDFKIVVILEIFLLHEAYFVSFYIIVILCNCLKNPK